MAANYIEKSYLQIAEIQTRELISMKKQVNRMKAFIFALFIALVAIAIGSYFGFKDFKANVEPEIEQSYPVPIEQLKEI